MDNFNGSVEIAGWDQKQCEIDGVKYANTVELRDRIKVDIEKTPNGILVKSSRPSDDWMGNDGVRYVIHVPRNTELNHISTSNGAIRVSGIDNRADLKTSNGAVNVSELKGQLGVHTSNGRVSIENVMGPVTLRSSNGSIHVEHVAGAVVAATSNSGITVSVDAKAPADASLKLDTNNGPIDVTLPVAPRSEIRAHTSNGGITVRAPDTTSAKVRMHTTHGEVHSDFRADSAQVHKNGGQHDLDETIGTGGPVMDLQTSNCNIKLLRM